MSAKPKRNNDDGGGLVFSTNTETMRKIELGNLISVQTIAPEAQRLTVVLDTKSRKGKIVTLVTGFEGKESDLVDLGKRLKASCGVGGSAKDGEIIVQGNHVDKVHALLIEWGYKKTKKRG